MTLHTPISPIAAGFADVERAAWLALVEKTIKGASLDTLVTHTDEGVAIAPLYAAGSAAAPAAITAAPRHGERAWDVRAIVRAVEPSTANRQVRDALSGGASSVLVGVDPTGANGVAVGSAAELAAVLDGVMPELATVALDAGFHGVEAARWLAAAAKAAPAALLAFHNDPISAFAAQGASPGPITAHVAHAANALAPLTQTYPKASVFLAGGSVVHEAGGSPAWELGFASACAVAYAKALVAAGMSVDESFARIVLGFSIDQEPLISIAKLRAARVIWRRITAASGAETPARIEARSSRRMLTVADAWSNLVRLTAAGFAAAAGGADAIVLESHIDAAGEPDDLALRMARNTQLILMEEANVGRVVDPLAGAWSIETLTADLARAGWAAFTAIEAAGGIVPALTTGLVADRAAASRGALATSLREGGRKIVGVNAFKNAEAPPEATPRRPRATAAPDITLPGAADACPALTPVRFEEMA